MAGQGLSWQLVVLVGKVVETASPKRCGAAGTRGAASLVFYCLSLLTTKTTRTAREGLKCMIIKWIGRTAA